MNSAEERTMYGMTVEVDMLLDGARLRASFRKWPQWMWLLVQTAYIAFLCRYYPTARRAEYASLRCIEMIFWPSNTEKQANEWAERSDRFYSFAEHIRNHHA